MKPFDPLALIRGGKTLNKQIIAFARKHGLECEPLWHNLPVWQIHDSFTNGRQRHLQVVAFCLSIEPYLSLVSAVHLYVDEERESVPKRADANRFPLSEVKTGRRLDPVKLGKRLWKEWNKSKTLQYRQEEMMLVGRSDLD